jgi:hypothetical protein
MRGKRLDGAMVVLFAIECDVYVLYVVEKRRVLGDCLLSLPPFSFFVLSTLSSVPFLLSF